MRKINILLVEDCDDDAYDRRRALSDEDLKSIDLYPPDRDRSEKVVWEWNVPQKRLDKYRFEDIAERYVIVKIDVHGGLLV